MKKEPSYSKFSFQQSAIYKIEVVGSLDQSWSQRLNGMQITIHSSQKHESVSVLIGQLNDQSALSGVLNTLHDYHVPVLSVTMLEVKSNK